jgi:hypothetical protein
MNVHVYSLTFENVQRTVTCLRLPDRYPGPLKVPMSHEAEEASVNNNKIINHNMNLQTALIINTLSKVASAINCFIHSFVSVVRLLKRCCYRWILQRLHHETVLAQKGGFQNKCTK